MSTNKKGSGERRTVLIVEDDLILNLLYEGYLEKLGFDTEGELVYGKTAVESTRRLEPDLIIMDIALEGEMDGIEAMEEIRAFSNVPVIYITGNSDLYNVKRAEATGYIDFLMKPITFQDLKKSVQDNFEHV